MSLQNIFRLDLEKEGKKHTDRTGARCGEHAGTREPQTAQRRRTERSFHRWARSDPAGTAGLHRA